MSEIPEHAYEPVPGLPAELPQGERILWQGAPSWQRFAIHALHVRKAAIYFVALLGLRAVEAPGFAVHLKFIGLAACSVALLAFLAWLMARSTLYTITNRRVVMRFGIALPMSINLPFSQIEAVHLRARGRRFGDVAIRPEMNRKLSYLVVWPHVRPWRFSPLQPMLRCIDDAHSVCRILGEELAKTSPSPNRPDVPKQETPRGERPRPFPLPPLLGATALLVVSVASVAWFRLTGNVTTAPEIEDPVASIALRFADQPDGSVLVFDDDTDEMLDNLAPGTNNFLRATLRGLVRDRRARGDVSQDAFELYRTRDGRLLLVDPITDRRIDLRAFGSSNANAFARFLPAAIGGTQLSQAWTASGAVPDMTNDTHTLEEASP